MSSPSIQGNFCASFQVSSKLPCASVSNGVFAQNLSYENEFESLHENKPVGGTLFHKNGFANSEMA